MPAKRPHLDHQEPEQLRRHERQISRLLDAATVEQLAADYVAGTSTAELGRRYGPAKETVLSPLRAAGVSVRYPRLSTADVIRVVELCGQGLTQTEIAAQVSRSPGAVWHVLRRSGLVGDQRSRLLTQATKLALLRVHLSTRPSGMLWMVRRPSVDSCLGCRLIR